ncbi:MAG: RsmB/NOP family class I SAM-dependent RNA methyltransferase, partial [Cephaloticoccus sp.]
MPADQTVLNHAARILVSVNPKLPADSALRRYFQEHPKVSPGLRRVISRTVFTYFRWFNWLDARESLQRQLAQAEQVAARFARDPRSIKAEALAARAVPSWGG